MASLDKIALGQYVPAESLVHALDPRAKIILIVFIMAAIFMTHTLPGFAAWGVMLFVAARTSSLPMRMVVRSARPVLVLVIFTSIFHIFFTPGTPIFYIFGAGVSAEGLSLAAAVSLRLAYLVMYASLLTFTTTPAKIADGLEGLMSPLGELGFPAHDAAMMITIALRFIPTLFEETSRIIKAQKSRGAEFDAGGLIRRAKAYIPVLIPLFVIVFRRAENLAAAMEARGYRGGSGRTRLHPLKWSRRDSAAVAALLSVSALLVFMDRFLFK